MIYRIEVSSTEKGDSMIHALRLLVAFALLFESTTVLAAPGIKIMVTLNPGGSFVAESSHVAGNVQSSGPKLTAEKVTLDLTTLTTGISLRDNHMKNKYFEVAKYPTAILTAGHAESGKFTGNLTVHGVTQSISGTYKQNGKDLIGTFECTLSQFKIPPAKYMGVGVEDKVKVEVTLPFSGK